MAVNISDGVTAGDIVSKLQKRSRLNKEAVRKQLSDVLLLTCSGSDDSSGGSVEASVDSVEQFLFEVGGNIGEGGRRRRL